jgi:hypothetical protein
MKKVIITAAIFLSCIAYKSADAQVSLSINIGSQPEWGPTGYDHADYYYMPDIDTYYDVPAHQYVYLENNTWVRRASLPARYSNYNVYNGYKVVVNEPNPWVHATTYRTKYAGYRGRTGQTIIRDSRDVKYRNHWSNNNNRPVRVENRKVVKHTTKVVHKDNHGNDKGHDRGHRN